MGDSLLVELQRPEVRNAIDQQTVDELHRVCDSLERDPRIMMITGSGGIFAAGADISQMRDRGVDEALRGINSRIFDRVHRLPMPTIALIDGYALGGGAELAYACDFRIGTSRAKFGNPEIGLGIIAGAGSTWRLTELIGEPLAKEVLLAGRVLTAEDALTAHLLNEIVLGDELLAAGQRLCERISVGSAHAIRLTKANLHAPRSAHPYIDDLAQAVLFQTTDKYERMTKFLEGREK